jgi:hypothetical protein
MRLIKNSFNSTFIHWSFEFWTHIFPVHRFSLRLLWFFIGSESKVLNTRLFSSQTWIGIGIRIRIRIRVTLSFEQIQQIKANFWIIQLLVWWCSGRLAQYVDYRELKTIFVYIFEDSTTNSYTIGKLFFVLPRIGKVYFSLSLSHSLIFWLCVCWLISLVAYIRF